ncbi:hypothetical protein LXL04_014413 [Taraxacum kok-saghyz]
MKSKQLSGYQKRKKRKLLEEQKKTDFGALHKFFVTQPVDDAHVEENIDDHVEEHIQVVKFHLQLKRISEGIEDENLKSSCHRLEKSLRFEIRSDIDAEELYMELKLFETLETSELSNPIDVLKFMKELDYFPNACIAYRILLTIPVTVASAERSFSKLKLLKSYLRSTMTQERLSGLAMISIENEMVSILTMNTYGDFPLRWWVHVMAEPKGGWGKEILHGAVIKFRGMEADINFNLEYYEDDDLPFPIATNQTLRCPATFIFVIRAFSTLEGIGYALDPKFSFIKITAPSAQVTLLLQAYLTVQLHKVHGIHTRYDPNPRSDPAPIFFSTAFLRVFSICTGCFSLFAFVPLHSPTTVALLLRCIIDLWSVPTTLAAASFSSYSRLSFFLLCICSASSAAWRSGLARKTFFRFFMKNRVVHLVGFGNRRLIQFRITDRVGQ